MIDKDKDSGNMQTDLEEHIKEVIRTLGDSIVYGHRYENGNGVWDINYAEKHIEVKYSQAKRGSLNEVDIMLVDYRNQSSTFADYYTDVDDTDMGALLDKIFMMIVSFFAGQYRVEIAGKILKKEVLVFDDPALDKVSKK